ncbi:hypothetical protein AB0L53_04260 [Nonomuraea sp. NPDC052129]|uniref:hypothetical protein n=1 Tax=Nonomuraea sp. NPDC052129 TaxID=3154651 RepID=UPI00343C45AD
MVSRPDEVCELRSGPAGTHGAQAQELKGTSQGMWLRLGDNTLDLDGTLELIELPYCSAWLSLAIQG